MPRTPEGAAPGGALDLTIRCLRSPDRPAAARLLDDAVGAGFWAFDDADAELAFVAVQAGTVVGVILARLAPADDRDAQTAFGRSATALVESGDRALHVRELAVEPRRRRTGVASRLLAREESEAQGRGARAAFVFAWLPAGSPQPDAVPFYEASGYDARADIAGFYAEGSVATGAQCPYCGEPPCGCSARPFVKRLVAPG